MKIGLGSFVFVALCSFWVNSATASVIVVGDPDGVFPFDLATQPDAGEKNIWLGRIIVVNGIIVRRPDGEVNVTAGSGPNEISTDNLLLLGVQEGTTGTLNVIGDGSPGSARVTVGGSVSVGGHVPHVSDTSIGGTGLLNIANGGHVAVGDGGLVDTGGFLTIGSDSTDNNGSLLPNGVVTVDGAGSLLSIEHIFLGDPTSGSSGQLHITNGGRVEVSDSIISYGFDVGFGQVGVGENSNVFVEGSGSTLTANIISVGGGAGPANNIENGSGTLDVTNGAQVLIDTKVNEAGFGDTGLVVGFGAIGEVTVDGAGSLLRVENTSATFGGQTKVLIGSSTADYDPGTGMRTFAAGDGTIKVTNDASMFVAGDIFVGGANDLGESEFGNEPNSTGRLIVDNFASVEANNIFVDTGGTLSGSDGFITSNVIVRGGTLAPGSSPGSMFIDGDLILEDGILELEIAGDNIGEYDQLFIGGDFLVSEGFTFAISFLDGFVPLESSAFDIFEFLIPPSVDWSTINVVFSGLTSDFDPIFFSDDPFSLSFKFEPVDNVPTPPMLLLLLTGLFGIVLARRRRQGVLRN